MARSAFPAAAFAGFLVVASARRLQNKLSNDEQDARSQSVLETEGDDFNGTLYKGEILHFIADPFDFPAADERQAFEYFPSGGLAVDGHGLVQWAGKWSDAEKAIGGGRRRRNCKEVDYSGKLIIPGFVDTHIHAPQIGMTAAYGEALIPWLNKYTFPAESRYANKTYAAAQSERFIEELLRTGTTTPLAFSTRHEAATDAVFEAATKVNMRIIAGKVLMDEPTNTPEFLRDESALQSYTETKNLIGRWHKKGRNLYAVTPRFAPTSTLEQMKMAGDLLKEFPDVYMHTHMSENLDEVSWVNFQFGGGEGADPKRAIPVKGYLDVYDYFGLLGPRSIFAHSIHLSQKEWDRLAETNSTISWCPTSNNFLGSGLFNLRAATAAKVRVGLGTDIGAGTAFSMIRTLGEAYKVTKLGESWMKLLDKYTNQSQLCENPDFPECGVPSNDIVLSAAKGVYLATLGGARQLSLDDKIGNFLPGKEADFVVLDWAGGQPFLEYRLGDENLVGESSVEQMLEKMFVLMMMGDDRHVDATYIMGKKQYSREGKWDGDRRRRPDDRDDDRRRRPDDRDDDRRRRPDDRDRDAGRGRGWGSWFR